MGHGDKTTESDYCFASRPFGSNKAACGAIENNGLVEYPAVIPARRRSTSSTRHSSLLGYWDSGQSVISISHVRGRFVLG